MSYTKYEWVDGEVITAEKLNHIEDGIEESGSGSEGESSNLVKVVTAMIAIDAGDRSVYFDTYPAPTYQELNTFYENGGVIIFKISYPAGNTGTISVLAQKRANGNFSADATIVSDELFGIILTSNN